jgi:hypothetical protein
MDDSLERQHYRFLTAFRVICYLCALYFLAMGVGLMLFPAFVARVAGPQNPIILGMLRGAGGSIVPYALLYVIVARSPISRRWGVAVIAVANTVAIVLDVASVYLGEYRWSYAMIDIPVEVLSLLVMVGLLIRCGGSGCSSTGPPKA